MKARKVNLKLNDAESDSESDQSERTIQQETSKPCRDCQNRNMSLTAAVKCPGCFWHDNYSICPICGCDVTVDNEHIKDVFARCNCGATCHENFSNSLIIHKVNYKSPHVYHITCMCLDTQ